MSVKYSRDGETSFALGAFPTLELIKAQPDRLRTVYLHPKAVNTEIAAFLSERVSDKVQVSDKVFRTLSDKGNVFVIGEFEKYRQKIRNEVDHIVLHGAASQGNLGTIIRTCAGMGMGDVVLIDGDDGAIDYWHPKVVRASMGAVFHVQIEQFGSFKQYADRIDSQRPLFMFVLDRGAEELQKLVSQKPSSLIFGAEGAGLPQSVWEQGRRVFIPQSQEIDSYNLAVAVALGIYQLKVISPANLRAD